VGRAGERSLPLAVYVPRAGTWPSTTIVRGSGIVGTPLARGRVEIHYEGNLYKAANIRTFADRVHHAAGRHLADYPTAARDVVAAEDLVAVGHWDGEHVRLEAAHDERVADWLGVAVENLALECERTS
jgi:hypothetical protein